MVAEQARLQNAFGFPHLARKSRADNARARFDRNLEFEAFLGEDHHELFPVVAAANVARETVRRRSSRRIAAEAEGFETLAVETDLDLVGRVVAAHEIYIIGLQLDGNPIFAIDREVVFERGAAA